MKILVATDGSPRSEKAADAAIMLAKMSGAELQVISVVDPGSPRTAMDIDPDVYDEIKEDDLVISDEVEAERKKPEQQFVSRVADRASGEGVQVSQIISVGDAAEKILSTAKENSVDMIVVGTHGRSPVVTAVMGSIATKVIHGGMTPVLVVPYKD